MPKVRWQHEARSRISTPSQLPVAHGGRIPRTGRRLPGAPVASSRRFAATEAGYRNPAPEAGFRSPAPEAAYRPGAPIAGAKRPAPIA